MNFQDLSLSPAILKALKDVNYSEPTPIQAQAIPLVLDGQDVLGIAQTGTGKTAAFSIPIIQHLIHDLNDSGHRRTTKSLIITPTRELAIQIGESIQTYAKYTDIKYTVVYGGVPQSAQKQALQQGVDVLVATPGRLLDLMDQGHISLKDIQYFVLDEADRMLDMGFINDVKKVIAKLPKRRQSLFFSATMPENIVELSRQILTDPKKVAVTPVSSTAETIQQYLYLTNRTSKPDLLLHVLKNKDIQQVLLFSRTKHGADRIVRSLKKKNIESAAIHGDKAQTQRQKALSAFKAGSVRVLVATDIASRGIDIDKLKYVINYDIPNEPESYVHRIGRCGRAGEQGIAISICEPEETTYIQEIEKLTKQKLEIIKNHPFPQTDKSMTPTEKKQWEKEKVKRRQEFHSNRKKNTERR